MQWRERTCGHAGVQVAVSTPAHAHDEFEVRVEGPLADIRFGRVQSVCEGTGARRSANGCILLYTNCSGFTHTLRAWLWAGVCTEGRQQRVLGRGPEGG